VGDLTGALAADSLNESHPILQEVSSPNEINSLFDSISYSKVRMSILHVLPVIATCLRAGYSHEGCWSSPLNVRNLCKNPCNSYMLIVREV